MSAAVGDAIEIVRALQKVQAVAGRQRVFTIGASFNGSATPSTTDTVNFSPVLTINWDELPDGIYIIAAIGMGGFSHSGAGNVGVDLYLDGVGVGTVTQPCPSATHNKLGRVIYQVDYEVAGGAGVEIELRFRAGTAGTAGAANPMILAVAILLSE